MPEMWIFSGFSVSRLQNLLHNERPLYTYRALKSMAPKFFLDSSEQFHKMPVDSDVEELLSVIKSCISSDITLITSTVAQMAAEKSATLVGILENYGWNQAIKQFDQTMLFSNRRLELIRELEKYAEDKSLVNEIDKAEKLLTDKKNIPLPYEVILVVHEIAYHTRCPDVYKRLLIEHQSRDKLHKQILKLLRELRSKTEAMESN